MLTRIIRSLGLFAFGLIALSASVREVRAQCANNAACHNDNAVCTCDTCNAMMCKHAFTIYGNTNCDHAAVVNIDDILCTLNGFAVFANCPNGDLKPNCTGNNIINIDDVLAVLSAFSGQDPCGCAQGIPCDTNADCDDGLFCNGAETCVNTFCQSGAVPCPNQGCSEVGDVCTGAGSTVVSCVLSSNTAPRGTHVDLEVTIESVTDLRGYQVVLDITKLSGPGTLDAECPDGVFIETARPDYILAGHGTVYTATDCDNERAAGAILSGGATTTPPKYAASFDLTVSSTSSSCTQYRIDIAPFPETALRDSNDANIAFVPSAGCMLQVTGNSGVDCNANGTPDECEPDCQPNGIADACDLSSHTSMDCNLNNIPDECEIDCQHNNRPDSCDISMGFSQDCNGNQIPDECEANDCQPNGIPDSCDIAGPVSTDCNNNNIPDECDLAAGIGSDCQPNGVFDQCEIMAGTSQDFNSNGIPDECDAQCTLGCGDNNVCTCDKCLLGICSHTNKKYGDVNCSGGAINLDDVLCTLAGFSNFSDCRNADISPPCTGNGVINLDDILRVLSAFGGVNACACP